MATELNAANSARIRELSVVIPAYGGEHTLAELLHRAIEALESVADTFEIIVVNDGSTDGTSLIVSTWAAKDPRVRLVDLLRNFGQHNATLAGIRAARYSWCVTMDADLQHRPEDLGNLLRPLFDGVDLVYGTPLSNVAKSRGLASRLVKWMLHRLGGVEFATQVSAFRAFRTDLRDAFDHYQAPFVNIDVLLSWGASRITDVRVVHDAPFDGRSTYSTRRLITHTINMITGFSVRPLKLASLLGVIATGAGAIMLIATVLNYAIRGGGVPGFTTLSSLVLLFSGVQLVILGIIGEYLARVHLRTQDRPPYVVRRPISEIAGTSSSHPGPEIDHSDIPVRADDR